MTRPARFAQLMAIAMLVTGVACDRRGATQEDCQTVFERLVELETTELGYRDPIAVGRTMERLRRELAVRIASCKGRALKPGALRCVRQARRAEEITHACLE